MATLEAVENVGGSFGGALAPLLTGLIVERIGSFNLAFLVAAVVAAVSGVSYALVRADAYEHVGHSDGRSATSSG